MSERYRYLVMGLSGLMCWTFFIFYVVLPYIAVQNPTTTLTMLEAQTLAFPGFGVLFEPIIMWIMLLAIWLLAVVVIKQGSPKKKKTTTTSY